MTIPNSVVIVICIVGAAAVVLVGYAFHRATVSLSIFGGDPNNNVFNDRNPDQVQYMADLRASYRAELYHELEHELYQEARMAATRMNRDPPTQV